MDLQTYSQWPAADGLVGDMTHVDAVRPLRHLLATRAGGGTVPGRSGDDQNTVPGHDRFDVHSGQLRQQKNQSSDITRHQRS
jgi:hypothetical protein